MGLSEIFCCICGCPLQDVEYNQHILPKIHTRWLSEFRVMGRAHFSLQDQDTTVNISSRASLPPGYGRYVNIDNTNGVTSEWRLDLTHGVWVVYEVDEAGTVLFPIHTGCLAIAERVLDWREDKQYDAMPMALSSTQPLESLYKALCRKQCSNNLATEGMRPEIAFGFGAQGLEWEHGYYGARQFWCQAEWESEDKWEWLCADPTENSSLTEHILSCLHPLTKEEQEQDTILTPFPPPTHLSSSSSHCLSLEDLPYELLSSIMSFISITSVLRLRRCNKSLAAYIPLNQRFWRDSLLSSRLVGYLWDLDCNLCRKFAQEGSKTGNYIEWDWRRLARFLLQDCFTHPQLDLLSGYTAKCQKKLEKINVRWNRDLVPWSIGLLNRRRIWRIVEDLETMDRR